MRGSSRKKSGFGRVVVRVPKNSGFFPQPNLPRFGGQMKKFLQYYSVDVPHVLYVDKKDS